MTSLREELLKTHYDRLNKLDAEEHIVITKTKWNKLPKQLKLIEGDKYYAGIGKNQTFKRVHF